MRSKSYIAIHLFTVICLISTSLAETRVSGNVSGRWNREGNPYIAEDNLTVPVDRRLIIEPGVEVQFEDDMTLFVYGSLVAIADEGDSIRFGLTPGGETWGGVRIFDSDSTQMDYCVITYGRALGGEGEIDTVGAGGNVFISGGNVIIDHSRISGGRARNNGGGLAIWRASTIVRNTLINENESTGFGGGVSIVANAAPVFTNCEITDNMSVSSGGGVWIFLESDPHFDACTFRSNSCINGEIGNGGGVFMAEGSSPNFYKCYFQENTASAGGGVYARGAGTDPRFEWCYFWGNATNIGSRVGGAMYVRGGAGVIITYTRFIENNSNQGGAIYVKEPPHLTVNHCLFVRNAATRAGGAVAASRDLGEMPFTLNNCTFIDNRNIGGEPIAHTAYARTPGDGQPGSFILINSSIIFGPVPLFAEENRVTVRYSNVENGFGGEGNTDQDPGFFAGDTVWFVLSGNSPCIDSGDRQLPNDPDDSQTDRGWLHFPHDAWESLPEEPIAIAHTADDRSTVQFSYRNETGVPIFVTPMDRWNEGAREIFVDVSAITNDSDVEAVAWTQTGFYLAGGNSGDDPNFIYHVDDSLNLRERFEQPGGSEFGGYTDLATDGGTLLYGCFEDFIVEFSTDGEYGQDFRYPGNSNVCLAIGADFNNPQDFVDFYSGGSDGSVFRADAGMFTINSTPVGDTIQAIGVKVNSRAVYALTPFGPTKSMLWLVLPDNRTATPLYTINIPDGYMQGGVEISQDYRVGKGYLFGIFKGDGGNGDKMFAMELYTSWLVIKPNLRLLEPGEEMVWPIEFAGDQMPPGFYQSVFYLAVNGFGQDGEVAVSMRSDPGKVGGEEAFQPDVIQLTGPYPNPFNSESRLRFTLDHPAYAEIWLTDLGGRSLRRLAGGFFPAGEQAIRIDAGALAGGQYFVKLVLPHRTLVRPLTLIK